MTHAEVGFKGTKSMEVKKDKDRPANNAAASLKSAKIVDFVGEVKQEIFRVNWTSWEELKVYTQIVIGATFAFGIGLYVVDLGIQSVLNGLGVIVRLISG